MHRRTFLQQFFGASLAWQAPKPELSRAYLDELAGLMHAAPVPGTVIGVLQSHRLSWIAPLGIRAEGTAEPVTSRTLFQAASLTKQVTAYAAFALRAQGKLDFDKPLVFYVDDLRVPAARTVTVRHVLSHSSGFPNWRRDSEPELTPAFTPGTQYRYSGEGFFYLQRVLEQVSGKGFCQLVEDLVFQPLGMKSSTLVWDPETLPRTALPHGRHGEAIENWDGPARRLRVYAARAGKSVLALRYAGYSEAAGEPVQPALPDRIVPNGASSLITSAEDYARFLAAAIRNAAIVEQQVKINEFLGWGLGWAIERVNGRTYVFQWGDNPGFKNIVMCEPATGNAVFVFTNGDSGAHVYDRAVVRVTGHDHPALFWL